MIKNWILGLLAVGFLVSALKAMAGEKNRALQFACGLLVLLALLYPLTRGELHLEPIRTGGYRQQVMDAVQLRDRQDREELSDLLARQCQDYVRTAALEQGVHCAAYVECRPDENGLPAPYTCRIETEDTVPEPLLERLRRELGLAQIRVEPTA